MRIRHWFLLALLTTSIFLGNIQRATAEIYRWVDSAGRVHFGDRPQHQQAEKIEVNADVSEQQRKETESINLQLQQLYREFKQQDSARLAQQESLAQKKKQRDARCKEASKYVKAANSDYAIYRLKDDGSKAYLTDQEIEDYRSEVNSLHQKHCDE